MITIKIYWKQFVGWATGLKHKYVSDPFFKSEFNVISLQIIFAICLIAIVAIYFNNLFQSITASLLQNLIDTIEAGLKTDPAAIIAETGQETKKQFVSFLVVAILVTIAFSYVIARITLRPVRTALATQKRFISDIAHELRTPLSIIKTNIEVGLLDSTLPRETTDMLQSNIEELDRTSEIINNLLSFNQLIRPGKINFTQVDLGAVVDKSIANLKELAMKKQHEIIVQKTPPYFVLGNSTALEQVVVNLLKNAITYTPQGGSIRISIEPHYGNDVLLTIEDSGVGISRNDLMHIFEPFYRAERSRNRRSGSGSGLGLTIVSELVKLHSGRIEVKSYPNKGTIVNILLPQSDEGRTGTSRKERSNSRNEVSIDFMKKVKK